MDGDKAIEIIRHLSNGVDPYTGKQFPPDSPYQNADTVRALYLALEGLDKLKRSKARATDGARMAGQTWTDEEEQRVLQQFDAKVDVSKIAAELGRTTGAIWARLEKLGRIEPRDRRTLSPRPPSPRPPPGPPDHEDGSPF